MESQFDTVCSGSLPLLLCAPCLAAAQPHLIFTSPALQAQPQHHPLHPSAGRHSPVFPFPSQKLLTLVSHRLIVMRQVQHFQSSGHSLTWGLFCCAARSSSHPPTRVTHPSSALPPHLSLVLLFSNLYCINVQYRLLKYSEIFKHVCGC